MQEGTPVPPWGYRCVPGLNKHNHVDHQNSDNMIVDIKLSTKHLHKFLYKKKKKKKKSIWKRMFSKKYHPFTKGSVGACMQILNLMFSITPQPKTKIYSCYKNIILGEKNSIASSHGSKLSVSIDLNKSYRWYKTMLSANIPFYSSCKNLILRGSLVFHCSSTVY